MSVTSTEAIEAAIADRRMRAEEYATWVATQAIDIDGVRAFNVGDSVPNGHVKRFGWDSEGYVARRNTSKGEAAHEAASPATQPARNASKEEWQTFALGQASDLSDEQILAMSKADLVSTFGSQE